MRHPTSPRHSALLATLGMLGLLAGLPPARAATEPTPPAGQSEEAFRAETQAWQRRRIERLTAADGWLTLVGLDWLEPGENLFGSAADNRVVLRGDGIPPVAGSLVLENGHLNARILAPGSLTVDGRTIGDIELKDDLQDEPTVLQLGTVSIQVVKRSERWAARIKDSASPVRTGFKGLEWFEADPRFRVEATLVPAPPGKTLPITNILGFIEQQPTPGALEFDLLGQHCRVEPIQEDDSGDLFLMIADGTSGKETYGAGRYIVVNRSAESGKWVIDFNHAYNPPCAFTAFATCPLPPKGNRLPLRVTAGERRYAGDQAAAP